MRTRPMATQTITIVAALLHLCCAFSPLAPTRLSSASYWNKNQLHMFFAEEHESSSPSDSPTVTTNEKASSSPSSADVQLIPCSGDEDSIHSAAAFMVDAFWLQSPQQLIQSGSTDALSESTRSNLQQEQARDFMEKYGERMGKRLLNSCLLTAVDSESKELLGVVGMEVSLFNDAKQDIIGADISEVMLKNAVSALGPKQRRFYKNSSAKKLANELLSPDIRATCCLSNLAVSPNARRRGIAKQLCVEAEKLAMDWGYNEMHLKVENENTAARGLYENQLGYALVSELAGATALRVDADSGSFVETTADTLILTKRLG